MATELIPGVDHTVEERVQAVPLLTPRQRQVLLGMCRGLTSRMIAAQLGIAQKTVEAHRYEIYLRLGAHNAAEAVFKALNATGEQADV